MVFPTLFFKRSAITCSRRSRIISSNIESKRELFYCYSIRRRYQLSTFPCASGNNYERCNLSSLRINPLSFRHQSTDTLISKTRPNKNNVSSNIPSNKTKRTANILSTSENRSDKWLSNIGVDLNYQDTAMDFQQACEYLQLEKFSTIELENSFQKVLNSSETLVTSRGNNRCENEQLPYSNLTSGTSGHTESQTIDLSRLTIFLEQRIEEIEEKRTKNGEYHHLDKSETYKYKFAEVEAKRLLKAITLGNNRTQSEISDQNLTQDEFTNNIKNEASNVNYRKLFPITMSMLLVGSSVGITNPVMPFLVQELGLTAGAYGIVVSAFALSKMLGNIPSAVLVERHGRKPYVVYSLLLIALGVGGNGFATCVEHMYLCRLIIGAGVAGLSTAATMMTSDISTPLNRASTLAPIMSAFSAGLALGPAFGGVLCDAVGIRPTFYFVSGCYLGVAAINNVLIEETKNIKQMKLPWLQENEEKKQSNQKGLLESFSDAVGQWSPLLKEPSIRNVCLMNAFYWIAQSGAQITLLPLILTNPDGLAMTATDVGKVYMGMSGIQVLGTPIFAKIVDRVGKKPAMIGGGLCIFTGMATLPFCCASSITNGTIDMSQLAFTLGIWATGSSLMNISPVSYISDKVDDNRRAQAIALLRTTGDIGFLIGASSVGFMTTFWDGNLDLTIHTCSGILLAATTWFTARSAMNMKILKNR